MKAILTVFLLSALGAAGPAGAGDKLLTDIEDIRPHQIKVAGFSLDTEQKVAIEAIGFRRSHKRKMMFTDAWILDARTREAVWRLEDAEETHKSRHTVTFEDKIVLPSGDYEVYYSSYPFAYNKDWRSWNNFFDDLFGVFSNRDSEDELQRAYKREWQRFKITVTGEGRALDSDAVADLRSEFLKDTFVSMTALRDDSNERVAFELTRALDVEIYAIGEARPDGAFDYGWIMDLDTRKRVWVFRYDDSMPAGGAKKNRLVKMAIRLPAGKYVAVFVTDDSHATGSWNAAPPNDPFLWGMSLRLADSGQRRFVNKIDYEKTKPKNVIVDFTRLRNDECRSKAFTCKKGLDFRVYAIGEGKPGEMFDYAWIVDLRNHKKVWEMSYDNTEPAGGGGKNRLFDGQVRLEKGNYVLYSVTDDSHSYWDWNTAPPYDPEAWGVTLSVADPDYRPGDVVDYDQGKDERVLARVVRVHSDERERERFSLDRRTEIHIYAIGEGSHGEMYDYGWIEDADSGIKVWEMTYGETRAAGGARKNRLFDGRIRLDHGDYVVYFETDDSHSFDDWNQTPPDDPNSWGITLYRAEN